MKAALYYHYGKPDVLKIVELPKPVVGKYQVLVKVKAVGINPKDAAIRSGVFRFITGRKFPKKTGFDFSGVVEATGAGVPDFKPGDAVYGHLDDLQGGAAAEFLAVDFRKISLLPEGLSFREAAAMPCTYLTALQSFRDYARLKPGSKVLIYGASGGVGSAAIQVAKCLQLEVTALSSSSNEAFCRELGADHFIAYDREDVFTGKVRFDCFLQVFVVGPHLYRPAKKILLPGGAFVTLKPSPDIMLRCWLTRLWFGPRAYSVIVRSRRQDLAWLNGFISAGRLKPHIEHVFPLENITDAHRQIAGKHTRGKVVVEV